MEKHHGCSDFDFILQLFFSQAEKKIFQAWYLGWYEKLTGKKNNSDYKIGIQMFLLDPQRREWDREKLFEL